MLKIPYMTPVDLSPKMLEDIYSGKEISTVAPTSAGEAIVGVAPVFSYAVPTEVIGRVSVSYSVPQGFVDKLRSIANASEQYGQIKLLKNPIKFNYIVTLSIVTLVDHLSGDMVWSVARQEHHESHSGSRISDQ